MKRAILVFFVITIGLIVRGGAYPATARVTLAPRVEVQPTRPVAIKDIARIDGAKEPVRKIGEMTVASGPMPGKRAMLDASFVRLRLQAEIKGRVEVRGAERVELIGKCLTFGSESLADKARTFILDQLAIPPGIDTWRDGNRTYDVVIDRPPREIVVAAGSASELRPRLLNPTLRPGPIAVAVDVVVDGRAVASSTVSLSVKAAAEVLVATKAIRHGEALGSDNTAWDRREVTRKPDAVTQAESNLTGWIATRTLAAGTLITLRDIAAPYAVHRGETAALTVTCGRVTLRTTGEIKQDAKMGDTVRVRPAMSAEDAQAKVIGPGVVSITR